MRFILNCFVLSLGAEATQQENIPPETASSPQHSNPNCTLSNPSLMSSAPNILQPLTMNSSNGVLETIFPVEDTPSPENPHGNSEQGNTSSDSGHCRRRLVHSRPFSELYSEGFVPLDSDMTSPETPRNSQVANIENTISENRTSNSVDIASPNETTNQVQDSQNVLDNPDGTSSHDTSATSTSPQEFHETNQDSESQPMEIPEETNIVNESDILRSGQVDMTLPSVGNRNSIGSIGSIELTEDSPLRIMEESERVREEMVLSCENLLQDPSPESDDEQMDDTDDTILAEQESSLNSLTDSSMEDVLTSRTGITVNEINSIETQPMADRETDLLEAENHPNVSSVGESEGSRASRHVVECSSGSSVATTSMVTETQAGPVAVPEGSVGLQSQQSQHQAITPVPQLTTESSEERDVQMSLLNYVDHIVGDESISVIENAEQSTDNALVVETVGDNAQESGSTASARASEATGVESDSGARISSVTLPVEASEPVLLDVTSLQSTSTSEMLVDTPGTVTLENRVNGDGHVAPPQRPSRGKRLSRSSSDPRITHSKRLAERSQNSARGANQGENSTSPSRPPFVRRVTEPTTGQATFMHSEGSTVNRVNNRTALSSQSLDLSSTITVSNAVDPTSDSRPISPTESVVMAVPLSPPRQHSTHSGLTSPIVVADGRVEEAQVTPLPSPEFNSEGPDAAFDTQSTAAVVPASSVVNERAGNESPSTRGLPNDYVLFIPGESRQPSSAPSTLTREPVSANATALTNSTQVSRRRSTSQDTTSSVIYATPVSGVSSERYTADSSSFPRARVTALSENRRQSSSSGSSSSTQTRTVSEESQSLPRSSSHAVPLSSSSSSVGNRRGSEQVRDDAAERVNNNASPSSTSLPGPSNSSNNDQREVIHTLLRSYCISSFQAPRGPSSAGQPTTSTSPAQEPAGERRVSETIPRSANRRNPGRRQQGHPVHVSIQDQQQTRGQQARPEQQPSEEEPLPSSKKCEKCYLYLFTFVVPLVEAIFCLTFLSLFGFCLLTIY